MKTPRNTSSSSSGYLQHGIHIHLSLLLIILLCTETVMVTAQPNPPDNFNQPYAKFSPSMAIIIVVLIAALFFMGFFSIYIRHCSNGSDATGSIRRALSLRARRAAATRGLDASVIETFPTFSYSEVKDHKIGKGALECAVCLNEFEDDETLRLIPKCDHVFHPECIDAWLESHVTCPVCRANLVPQAGEEQVQVPDLSNTTEEINEVVESSSNEEIHVVQIDEAQPGEGAAAAKPGVNRMLSFQYPNRPPRSGSSRKPGLFGFGKFRSYSTGHSVVVQPGQNLDKFTLKLPEGVRKEVMDRAMLNRTGSVVTTLPREGSSRNGGVREGSNRGARSYRRIERSDGQAKSDRWIFNMTPQFFSRGLSMKSTKVVADDGEASTSKEGSGRLPVKMPSFKCLEPKTADEASLVSNEPISSPV